jgi:hypothetical protein
VITKPRERGGHSPRWAAEPEKIIIRVGHIIRHNVFVVNILEGAISRKKSVERPRLQYLKQVARKTAADSYTAKKRMACNKCRWKVANQSKD